MGMLAFLGKADYPVPHTSPFLSDNPCNGLLPFGEEFALRVVERGELGVAEDGGFHLCDGEL